MTGIKIFTALTIGGVAILALLEGGGRWLGLAAEGHAPVVRVVPATATLSVGDTLRLAATLRDESGRVVEGHKFHWWTPNRGVATVDESGLVVAVGAGSVTIAAITRDRSESGFSDITVTSMPVESAPPGSAGNPPAASDPMPVADSVIADEQPAAALAPAATGSAQAGPGPHEPDGFVELSRRPYEAFDENGWTDRHHGGRQTIEDGAMRITYPRGFVGGTAPGATNVKFGGSAGMEVVYVAHDYLLSPNWQGHGSSMNKMLYFNSQGGRHNILTTRAYGGPSETNFAIVVSASQTKASVNGRAKGSNLYSNRGGPKLTRGRRSHIEMIVKMNSAAGVHDGELHIWIDGGKTHEFSPATGNGINWFDPGEGSRIGQLKWTPVWGGVGGSVAQTMYSEMSYAYISGQ